MHFCVDNVVFLGFIVNKKGYMLTLRKSKPSKSGQHHKM